MDGRRIDAFELWCWRRLLRVPWTARRSNQSILKEISPGCSLEWLMLKLKLQYFGHLMQRADSLEKTDAGRDWGQEEKGRTEDEMAGWHHRLDGRESGWTPGVGDGQRGLVCCKSWVSKESDKTERLNWTKPSLYEIYGGFYVIIIFMWIANCSAKASVRCFCNIFDISVSFNHYGVEKEYKNVILLKEMWWLTPSKNDH